MENFDERKMVIKREEAIYTEPNASEILNLIRSSVKKEKKETYSISMSQPLIYIFFSFLGLQNPKLIH